jgi:hypothetical protein
MRKGRLKDYMGSGNCLTIIKTGGRATRFRGEKGRTVGKKATKKSQLTTECQTV